MHGMGEADLGDLGAAAHHRGGLAGAGGDVDRLGFEAFLLVEAGADGDVLDQKRHALAGEGDGERLQFLGCGGARGSERQRDGGQPDDTGQHRPPPCFCLPAE